MLIGTTDCLKEKYSLWISSAEFYYFRGLCWGLVEDELEKSVYTPKGVTLQYFSYKNCQNAGKKGCCSTSTVQLNPP